jgi:hypothetical protein
MVCAHFFDDILIYSSS